MVIGNTSIIGSCRNRLLLIFRSSRTMQRQKEMSVKYIVHYGAMRLLGVFSYDEPIFRYGSRVIVKTPRGQEVGIVRCEADQEILGKLDIGFIEDRIIRLMTETDEIEYRALRRIEQDNLERCQQIIQEMNIVMELMQVELTFGSGRLIIYYTADGRVDFRELVKVLTTKFHMRIEMRQINVREGMKLLHSIGDCGREICCGCFLHDIPTVSIKMAKLQRVTLDPAKISGHCGRLKCCLRYEHDCYVERREK